MRWQSEKNPLGIVPLWAWMIIVILVVLLVAVLAGCSGSGDGATIATSPSPATTSLPTSTMTTVPPSTSTTPAPTTTARSATTTSSPTTTTTSSPPPPLSRDAEVAVSRCIEPWIGVALHLKLGSTIEAEKVNALCFEALTQLDIEGSELARQLGLVVAAGNLEIAEGVARVVTADAGLATGFDDAAVAAMLASLSGRYDEVKALLP